MPTLHFPTPQHCQHPNPTVRREGKIYAPIMNTARVCFFNYSEPPWSVDPCFVFFMEYLCSSVWSIERWLQIKQCRFEPVMLSPLQPTLVYVLNIVRIRNCWKASWCTNHGMTHRLVNYLCKGLLARRRSLLITAALNFAPQTLTFALPTLDHFRNSPLAFSLLFKVFKDSSL